MNNSKLAFHGFSILNLIFWFNLSYLGALDKYYVKFTNVKQYLCNEVDNYGHVVPKIDYLDPKSFSHFRNGILVNVKYPGSTNIVNYNAPVECLFYIHSTVSRRHSCFSVVTGNNIGSNSSYNLVRYNSKMKTTNLLMDGTITPTGFFYSIPKNNGRNRLKEKFLPLLKKFWDINSVIVRNLMKKSMQPGDSVVVMVVNDGEIDLLFNYFCSVKRYGLSYLIQRIIVFTSSMELVSIIESTGALAVHDIHFGFVSRGASYGYLDNIFVDMMWYKTFSTYLLLRLGYNVLFQDVDVVWFRDPFRYITQLTKVKPRIDAFFSDDGQRTLRYSPFYANSGFFYMVSSERTKFLTWSIISAFNTLQATGSHQNVLTMRLLESLDMVKFHFKILPLSNFPSGIMLHHNETYMTGIKNGDEKPYIFHMCWTQGKKDKLKYLKKVGMWHLDKNVSLNELRPPSGFFYMIYRTPKKKSVDILNEICRKH
jgi:hypothetical protein